MSAQVDEPMPPAVGVGAEPQAASGSWLTRIGAFFRKEVNEIRRQPRLILSLVGGPLLVLGLFGAAFQNPNPRLRTVVVLPEGGLQGLDEARLRELIGLNFDLVEVTTDRARADELLEQNELDVVQIIPDDVEVLLSEGQNPTIAFRSNAISPMTEGWVQYLAYALVNEINREILKGRASQAQGEASNVQGRIAEARVTIGTLEQDLGQLSQQQARDTTRNLLVLIDRIEALLPAAAVLGNTRVAELRADLAQARASLTRLDEAISAGAVEDLAAEVARTQGDLSRLSEAIGIFVSLSPETIVAPVQRSYTNINLLGRAFDPVVYYAPGVLALLVQHTAVTLGALALVRERLMGALEVFRVAPVTLIQLLLGKYAAYTLFIVLMASLLTALLALLGVPILGNLLLFVALIVLLTLASLGVGFLISTVANSDSQAIQLSMITLLVSIFFSGLFIALDSFARPALAVSYSLPMTHGVAGLQDIMLRGLVPGWLAWVGLTALSLITFGLVLALFRRQLRRA
jgi:ABC-2 type transport system permease protein